MNRIVSKLTTNTFCASVIFLLGLCSTRANDVFADRIILSGTNVTEIGNNGGAGEETGEPIGQGTLALMLSTVWYSWTAPTSGVVYVTGETEAPNFILSLGVYRGAAVDQLTPVATTPDGGIPVTANDTIEIQVGSIYYWLYGGGGGRGEFTLKVRLNAPSSTSPNDAFADRLDVSRPTYHYEGSIYEATQETGEPLPEPNAQQTLWWRFEPPGDGLLNLTVNAGQFTPYWAVYEGAQLDSLTPLAPVSGSRYRVEMGKEYAIQLASAAVPSGDFVLETRFHSITNDNVSGSETLLGTDLTYYGNFSVATFEEGEPPAEATNTVWVSWAAPFTGPVEYSLVTQPYFQYKDVYQGPGIGHLEPVPRVGLLNGVYGFMATEGAVYHFRFCGGADDFIFRLQARPLLPATNDDFADAELAVGQVVYLSAKSVLGATMEPGEPLHRSGAQKSLWWKWRVPKSGRLYAGAGSSLLSGVVLALYQGAAVEALTLIGKSTTDLNVAVTGGETYYLAAAVPADDLGEVSIFAQVTGPYFSASYPVPGNVLLEPSWEGTAIFGSQHWHWYPGIGGSVGEPLGADGTTWPVVGSGGGALWQDITTVPGQQYAIRFAYQIGSSGCCGDARVQVSWEGQVLGLAEAPQSEKNFWHWADFVAQASSTTSRLAFTNLGVNLDMDAFSVVPLNAKPVILTQPRSISTFAGGNASFLVGASGSPALVYQWYLDSAPLAGATGKTLVLENVSGADVGAYRVVIANAFGSVTSAPAALVVETPTQPIIVLQPYGDAVAIGNPYTFTVAAVGSPPLHYQWFFEGGELSEATNRYLVLAAVETNHAGVYQVRVSNGGATVWSLPARLNIETNYEGGGVFTFYNEIPDGRVPRQAFVYQPDGLTKLSGTNFMAQLYAGPSLALIRPVGQPRPFQSGFAQGLIDPETVTLPTVPPLTLAFAQVRAWDARVGASYEEARALGGSFGRSDILEIIAGSPPWGPALWGLQSFSLMAGLPQLATGMIRLVEQLPDGMAVWEHEGEPGFRYAIEKSTNALDWQPYVVVTNVSATVTFSDAIASEVMFYRSRILD